MEISPGHQSFTLPHDDLSDHCCLDADFMWFILETSLKLQMGKSVGGSILSDPRPNLIPQGPLQPHTLSFLPFQSCRLLGDPHQHGPAWVSSQVHYPGDNPNGIGIRIAPLYR